MTQSAGIEEITVGDLPCWRLHAPAGEVLVARQGAQVLRYEPRGQRPVVWLSDTARFAPGEALRGGIPVCWPWFGQLERNPQPVRDMARLFSGAAPAHGLVRTLDWHLAGYGGPEHGGTSLMRLGLSLPKGLPGWPHAVELTLDIRLGDELSLTLATANKGAEPLVVSQALHTYFAVSDSRAIAIEGLDGNGYIETLENWEPRVQRGPVAISGETDRIYTGIDAPITIRDPGWGRAIRIEAEASRSAVVWNPWTEKSKRLSQFRPDAWQDMVCVETARVLDDVVDIPPGTTARMGVRIRSESL